MAVLKAKERNEMKKGSFGLPKERKYPMPDKAHAINAKARATQMENKGKLSKSSEEMIDRKANKLLGKTKEKVVKIKSKVEKLKKKEERHEVKDHVNALKEKEAMKRMPRTQKTEKY